MDDLKESLGNLTNTSGIEKVLLSIAYWIVILIIILLIFYVAVLTRKLIIYIKKGKKDSDDFL